MDHLFTKHLGEQKEKEEEQEEESDPAQPIFHPAQLTVNRDWTPRDPEATAQVSTASKVKLYNMPGLSRTIDTHKAAWLKEPSENSCKRFSFYPVNQYNIRMLLLVAFFCGAAAYYKFHNSNN